MRKLVRAWLLGALDLAELLVSAVVHLAYGFFIFAAAVRRDLLSRCAPVDVEDRDVKAGVPKDAGLDGAVPPIVLVHGIFGFGKGVRARPPPYI